jgi:alpha-mannosidase
MDEFPEFRFAQSQPQLYDYLRHDYPELFEAIRELVTEGRWEILGGMWVEADCNVSGGESLARQFLLGRTFFAENFGKGVDSPVLWLPDVFGYACNLPQLIKNAGLDYFFTIKLGWSQYNRYPYDSFWWEGLDGTRVLTHFSTSREGEDAFAATYNATASPATVLNTWTNFQQKDWGEAGVTPPLLMSYGYGDGGGGPTREMLENIREMASFPAMPQVKCGKVSKFFRDLEDRVGDRLPTWNGELYLEYHRGTYTTQARNKRANRKSEFLLHDAEFLASMAATLDPDYDYPHQEIHRAWQLVCLNQFHDIIPGSSIGEVYEESLRQYAEVKALGERVREDALTSISATIGGDLLVVNPTPFPQHNPALCYPTESLPLSLVRAEGVPVAVQSESGYLMLDIGELPPYSITPLFTTPISLVTTPDSPVLTTQYPVPNEHLLENDHLRVEFDDNGDITRIYDKRNHREVLPPSAVANQFQLFEDRPRVPDAWDIDIYYDDRMWLAEPATSVRVIESGPLRATLEVHRRVQNSDVVQTLSLAHNSARLDFDTTIQWRERHMMLKVAFPVDVLSPVATYEIQWGSVERPTHRNTSWDWARFETCAQKWVDLSEGGYGVSLLNDCKYGHDIRDNVIRLTLLRSPADPDPKADLGEHRFAYSLFPHAGSWDEATLAHAYALNDPPIVWPVPRQKDTGTSSIAASTLARRPSSAVVCRTCCGAPSFAKVDSPNVVIETIKQAEDGNGLILRIYESQRKRGEFTLTTGFPLAGAWRTNLLEENQQQLETDERGLQLFIKPYQILTLRLLLGSSARNGRVD